MGARESRLSRECSLPVPAFFASSEVLHAPLVSAREAWVQTLALQGIPGQLPGGQAPPTDLSRVETCVDELNL